MKKVTAPWDIVLCGDEICARRHDRLCRPLDRRSVKGGIIGIEQSALEHRRCTKLPRCRKLCCANKPHNADCGILRKYAQHLRKEIQPQEDAPRRQIDLILRIALVHRTLIGSSDIPIDRYLNQLHGKSRWHINCIEIRTDGRASAHIALCNDCDFPVIHSGFPFYRQSPCLCKNAAGSFMTSRLSWIFSSGQSHQRRCRRASIISGGKRYLMICAGLPPTIA